MANLYNRPITGKYYQLEHYVAQYIGNDDKSYGYLFQFTNILKKKIVIRKTYSQWEDLVPILMECHDYDTDNEFPDDPFAGE